MTTLPGLRAGITLDSATFIAEMRRVSAAVAQLGAQVERQNAQVTRGVGAISGALGVLKSAAIGLVGSLSIATVTTLGKQALDTAGNLRETAAAAGVTAKQLQVLTIAGAQAGISQEQLATGLGLFAKNLGDAGRGTTTFGETIKRYGISLTNADLTLRSSSDVLNDYADLIQNAGSETEKLSLLQEAFGKSGRKFINLFGEGSEGIRDFAKELEAAGLILSDEFIGRADEASDAIATLQLAVGAGFQIGVIEAFGNAVSDSVENLASAREAGQALGTAVGTSIKFAADAVAFLAENIEIVGSAIAGIVAYNLANFFLGAAAAIAQAARAMLTLNVALLANPIGLIAVAIGVAVAALIYFRDTVVTVGGITTTVAQIAVAAFNAITSAISNTLTAIGTYASALFSLATLDFAGALEKLAAAGVLIAKAFDAPKAAIEELRRSVAKITFQEFVDSVQFLQPVQAAVEDTTGGVIALSESLTTALADARNQNSQLKALAAAYQGVGASVEQVQAATEIDNKLRAGKITLLEAEKSGLLEILRANQQLEASNKAAAATTSVREEGEQIQANIDARGRETEELRIQLAIMAARNQFGSAYTAALEDEIVATEKLRSTLTAVQASRDLSDTIREQQLLLQFGGKETQEYRVQLRLLQLKKQTQAEITPELEAQVRQLEAQSTQIAAAQEQSAGLFVDAAKNAGAEIQRTFAETFENVLNGGVTTFKDLFEQAKQIAIKFVSEIATLLIFDPKFAAGFLGGGDSGAAGFGSLATAGTTLAAPQFPAAAPAAPPGVLQFPSAPEFPGAEFPGAQFPGVPQVAQQPAAAQSFLDSISSSINQFGSQLGFALPSTPVFSGRSPTGVGAVTPIPGVGPGGGIPPAAAGIGATLTQTLGAGAIGAVGGSIIGGAISGNVEGQLGGTLGGGLGAAAGFALGGPVGGLIGGGVGSLLGGLVGGLFGGGSGDNQGDLRFRSTPSTSAFDQGPFGGIDIGGENTFQAPLRKLVDTLDTTLAEFLTESQEKLGSVAVQALAEFSKREPESDPSGGFAEIIRERATAILGAAFEGLDFSKALEGLGSAEEVIGRVEAVLKTIEKYNELVLGVSPAVTDASNVLTDLLADFGQVRDGARELGLSVKDLNAAQREAVRDLRAQVEGEIADLLTGGTLSQGAAEFRQSMEEIGEQFEIAAARAEALGVSVEGLNRAQKQAENRLRAGAELDILELTNVGGQNDALIAFNTEILRLTDNFNEAAAIARELDLPAEEIQAIVDAGKDARQELRQQIRENATMLIGMVGSFGRSTSAGAALRAEVDAINRTFTDAIASLRAAGGTRAEIDALQAGRVEARQSVFRTALENVQALIDSVSGPQLSGAAAGMQAEIDALNAKFADARSILRETGRSVDELNAANQRGRAAIRERYRADVQGQIDDLISTFGSAGAAGGELGARLRQIDDQFRAVRESARALGLSVTELNEANQNARQAARAEARESLDELIASVGVGTGPAADFRQELERINKTFADARAMARELGISVDELNAANQQARQNLRAEAREQIDRTLASADPRAGPGQAFRQELERINETFAEARALARELGDSVDELNAANQQARQNLRAEAREKIADTIASADRGTGPAQAFRDELEAIAKRFSEARDLALALGDSVTALNAAEERALGNSRLRANAFLDELIATGSATGAGARYVTELQRIVSEFAAARDLARQLGRGIQDLVDAERQQYLALKDEVRGRIAALISGADESEALQRFRSDLDNLNLAFAEVRAGAEAFGLSVGNLADAQARATERLRRTAIEAAENQALESSRQFDALLSPLKQFQQELSFSVGNPVEQFRLAREEFERIAALAKSGDLSAIGALPQAGRIFLEQATAFGASPGRVEAEEQIQRVLAEVIAATTEAQRDATRGIENEIRRASDREIDTLREMVTQGQETVRELRRLVDAVSRARVA